ncbi:MAG: S24 family peptidase [Hyphomicrobium sp.]
MSVAEFFHSTSGPRLIPIVGYVSGGESFTPIDDHPPGSGIDHITLDMGTEDQIAVRVRGSSMAPVYRDGDAVIGTVVRSQRLTRAIGRDCIVKTRSGEGYLKILMRGTRAGVFRLRSYNPAFADIEDVSIDWAAPVTWVSRGA